MNGHENSIVKTPQGVMTVKIYCIYFFVNICNDEI